MILDLRPYGFREVEDSNVADEQWSLSAPGVAASGHIQDSTAMVYLYREGRGDLFYKVHDANHQVEENFYWQPVEELANIIEFLFNTNKENN